MNWMPAVARGGEFASAGGCDGPSRGGKSPENRGFRQISPPVYNSPMHDIPNRIADVLLEVEAILRSSGRWDRCQPPAGALLSSQPFCIDTLSFEQWLQWIFLPRMKQILEYKKPLPVKSGIFVYAQEQLGKGDPPAGRLLSLVKRFDDLISIHSGAKLH